MKTKIKYVIMVMTIALMVICYKGNLYENVYASEATDGIKYIQDKIINDSKYVVENKIQDFSELSKQYCSGCKYISVDKVNIENPYIIYNYEECNYQKNYKYPISYNHKVIFVIDVIKVNNNWS